MDKTDMKMTDIEEMYQFYKYLLKRIEDIEKFLSGAGNMAKVQKRLKHIENRLSQLENEVFKDWE